MSGEKPGYNPGAYDDGTGLTVEEKAKLDQEAAKKRSAMLREGIKEKKAATPKKDKAAASSSSESGSSRKGLGLHHRSLTEGNPAQAKAADIQSGESGVEVGSNRAVRKLLDSFAGEFKFDLVSLGDGRKYKLKLFVKNGITFDADKDFQGPFLGIMTQLEHYLDTGFSKK